MYSRNSFILAIFLFASFFLIHCEHEIDISRDYPLVKTLPVESVTGEGAILHGRIIGSPDGIDEYGFVWGSSIVLNIRDSQRVFGEGIPAETDFSFTITQHFENYHSYFVSSYLRSGELIIYGNTVEFSIEDRLNP